MPEVLPKLHVAGPDGQSFVVDLVAERVTIGRLPAVNSVALEPDPQQLITRRVHCVVECDEAGWWLTDNGSANGTFVRGDDGVIPVEGRQPLVDGMTVCILGLLTDDGEPRYWELTFRDPNKTRQVEFDRAIRVVRAVRSACVEYDAAQAKLYVVENGTRRLVTGLRPQHHRLLGHMARRNQDNGGVPILCTHEELEAAIWGKDAASHKREELARIVWELRRKLADLPVIENERSLGYRLNTCRPTN